jgi:Zn-dependent peptidase ImmA (M78 family)/DNA-binding XRE family transcriptional regulator
MEGISRRRWRGLVHFREERARSMTNPLEQMSPLEIGKRLQLARESADKKQAEAADAIGVARTTLLAIEKGQRRARMSELQQLAKLYGTSVNALLRQEAVHVDLVPRFRKLTGGETDEIQGAVQMLGDLARAEVELENLLGVKRVRNYPPERPLLPGDVREQAEHDALELRQRLGLGMGPIQDIVALLELDMGVRVYARRLPTKISGLFAYDEALGACILLNANHPRARRTQTGAHEAGHLLIRQAAEVFEEAAIENTREERYATTFGRVLLTPARAVKEKFSDITAGASQLTRRHVISLTHFFGVSREAMVRRLEELRLVKPKAWEWFEKNGGITDEQERQVLGDVDRSDPVKAEADKPTTFRLNQLACEAWRRELMSESQLARLLRLSLVEMREILQGGEPEGSHADGAPRLLA